MSGEAREEVREEVRGYLERSNLSQNKMEKIEKIVDSCQVSLEILLIVETLRYCKWHMTNALEIIREIEEEAVSREYQEHQKVIEREYQESLRYHNCQRLKEINQRIEMEMKKRSDYYIDDYYENNRMEIKKYSNGYHLT